MVKVYFGTSRTPHRWRLAVATTNDQETIIGPNQAALVAEENGELRLILPDYDDDEDVPPMVLLLAAIIVKLKDQDWLDNTMAALDDR